jgi:flagellar biosynthesis/type III secretory pathway M-ring protein FliF/YscJ
MTVHKEKTEYPFAFILVLFLFLASLGLIVFGSFKNRTEKKDEELDRVQENKELEDGEESLSKYFENKEIITAGKDSEEFYLQTDPFRETCAGSIGNKKPAVVSGTVCYY